MMKFTKVGFFSAFVCAAILSSGSVLATDKDQDRDQDRDRDQVHDPLLLKDKDKLMDQDRIRLQDQDKIFAQELMTPEERAEYQLKMRSAKTEEERMQIRNEHREQMLIRAKEQGVVLPE